jgi:hypothetical protein
MDLTDLVEDPLKGLDFEQSEAEFERRLKAIEAEFVGIEHEVFKLETVESQACLIECARLGAQLREIRGTRSAAEDEGSFEEGEVGEDGELHQEEGRYLLRNRVKLRSEDRMK